MRERISDQQPRMDGGLNDVSDDAALLPTQLRRAINVRLTEYGAAVKRGGTQRTSLFPLGGSAPPSGNSLLLETSGYVLLENTDFVLLEA